MKYFTEKIIVEIHSENMTIKEEANKKWDENAQEYTIYFESIKKYFSKKFLEIYYRNHGFHDMLIQEMSFLQECGKKRTRKSAVIILSNGDTNIKMIFKDILQYKVRIDNFDWCLGDELTWSYDEFYYTSDKTYKINILCDVCNEINVECKKILISEEKM